MVRLIKDDKVIVGEQLGVRLAASSDCQVAQEKRVIDQKYLGFRRFPAHPVVKAAVEEPAFLPFAGIGVGPDFGPAGVSKIKLRAVARSGRAAPIRYLQELRVADSPQIAACGV